jgi:hypothetical protein
VTTIENVFSEGDDDLKTILSRFSEDGIELSRKTLENDVNHSADDLKLILLRFSTGDVTASTFQRQKRC